MKRRGSPVWKLWDPLFVSTPIFPGFTFPIARKISGIKLDCSWSISNQATDSFRESSVV